MERITQHKSRGLSAIIGMATSVFLPGISSSLANAIGKSLDLGAFAIRATTAGLSALGTAAVAKVAGGDTSQIIAAGLGGAIAGGGVGVANEAVSRVFSPASISPAPTGFAQGSAAFGRGSRAVSAPGREVGRDRTLADATTGEITPGTALDVAASGGGAGSAGLTDAQSNVYAALLSTAFAPRPGEGRSPEQKRIAGLLDQQREAVAEDDVARRAGFRTAQRNITNPRDFADAERRASMARFASLGRSADFRGPNDQITASKQRGLALAGARDRGTAFYRGGIAGLSQERADRVAAFNLLPSRSVNPALKDLSASAALDEEERKKQQKILGDTFSDSLV